MKYQSIRATIEGPLVAAYNSLSPAIPVYFDNVINYDVDAVDEFVHVNIQFGLTNDAALTGNLVHARGICVVRVHTQKGQGPARNQLLTTVAYNVLDTLNNTPKSSVGTHIRFTSIDGPSFSPDFTGKTPDQQSRRAFIPYFISRLEAPWVATVVTNGEVFEYGVYETGVFV